MINGRVKGKVDNELIMSAYFEHHLKELYSDFIVNVLKPMTHDDLEFYRKFALNALEGCLEKRPELEDLILDIIVNKLGDTSKKVQCHTIYLLLKLSQAHLEMTSVILHTVTLFLQRNQTKPSHVYYSVAYLNRIASMVAPKDEKVRLVLLRTYFQLFRKILGEEEKSSLSAAETSPDAHKNPTKSHPPPVKKDRTKSKQENLRAAKEAAKKKHVELEEEDNKIAELVLKGVNILVTKCSAQLFGQYVNDAAG